MCICLPCVVLHCFVQAYVHIHALLGIHVRTHEPVPVYASLSEYIRMPYQACVYMHMSLCAYVYMCPESLGMREWRRVLVQLRAYPSISAQGFLCMDRYVNFSLLWDRVEQDMGGDVAFFGDKRVWLSVGHSWVTASTGCQVWACCRLMIAPLKRDRSLLAAAFSTPSSPCVDACSQSSKENPATLFIFYNCCFLLSPITFSFLFFPY